ncbi:LacI family DNA-binding transcriptional regulator [Companilactobacillus huachuanensis]|uniref:LacI family DNA-binding transcriptional regulator n=1 Tax=Companilactobacillus huachuanensis TaxID=2559914 RepID=A0ABW1RP39_9LACO|nr:LacI family DNA-binding transcriptional regulator [Companilactobacillus huachuanensis]
MTNIHDIARLSGYSVSTVSRVLNNSGYLSDTARNKIQKIIEEQDYVPNDVARDLSRGKTYNVGIVLPHTKHPYFTHLIKGIMETAFAKGYHVVLLPSLYNADIENQYLEQLRRKSYDALIFTSRGIPLKRLLKYQKYGSIICCENPGDYQIAAAYSLRSKTFTEAFSYVKNQGYHEIGILLSRPRESSTTSSLTLASYEAVYGATPKIINTSVTTYQDGYNAMAGFQKNEKKPDFIFANGDDVAAGARQYYLDNELSVPAMMGQENQLSGNILNIPTIDHHFHEVGRKAMELAISGEIKMIPINSELIKR